MVDRAQADSRASDLRRLHEARARAELAAADALLPGSDCAAESRGCLTPAVAVIKSVPGPAEAAGGEALSGADGDAAIKAIGALGHPSDQVFFALSRPASDAADKQVAARLRQMIEAVDPPLVIALDEQAASDLALALQIPGGLPAGRVVRHGGRRYVACDGLEASLGDPVAKRRVWRQLSVAGPEDPVY